MATKRGEKPRERPGEVVPFYKPRRVDPVRRMERGERGDCYGYAFTEIMRYFDAGSPAPSMAVVHGTVRSVKGERIEHAWIERGGFAYDWQMLAVHGMAPISVEAFQAEREPSDVRRYNAREVAAAVVAHNHMGPWP